LPPFDVFNQQRHFIDVFNRGKAPITEFKAMMSEPWMVISDSSLELQAQTLMK